VPSQAENYKKQTKQKKITSTREDMEKLKSLGTTQKNVGCSVSIENKA
jgi:hypothetical protein